MKKILLLGFFLLITSGFAAANQVEIVEIKGKVSIRENAQAEWANAAVGLKLDKKTEVKTGFLGKCTIAFDTSRQNTVTINKSTHVVIEDIIPGSVFLSKGRVLTLIRNLEKIGDFEIRTPTAVTGARGTGWETRFENGETFISVFENDIFVQGIEQDGRRTERVELRQDFRTRVQKNGKIQKTDVVPEKERERFKQEFKQIEKFMHDPYMDQDMMPPTDMPPPGGPMTVDQLILELQMQQESGNITPEEQAMLEALFEQQGSISNLPPEQQDQVLKQMGEQFGAYNPAMDPHNDPNYNPAMDPNYTGDPNAGNYTYNPQTGEYHDQEGNLMPPPEGPPQDGEHFNNYMDGINGPAPDGTYHDPYAGDQYFGEFDAAWGDEGGYYVNDPYHEFKDDFHDAIHDENQEGYICPEPPPCWWDYQVFCPSHIIPPPPECPNQWPPECNPAHPNACN